MIFLFLALFVSQVLPSSISVTLENSPYIVGSSTIVDTFDVREGSSVFFKSGAQLTVKKFFSSTGTASAGVIFSSAESTPTAFDWPGIILDSNSTAFIVHTTFSYCIECIVSNTNNVIIDSTYFKNIGQDDFSLLGLQVASGNKDYFSFNAEKRQDLVKGKSNKWFWIAGGVIGISAVSIPLYLSTKKDKPTISNTDNGNVDEIKYPNLPQLE